MSWIWELGGDGCGYPMEVVRRCWVPGVLKVEPRGFAGRSVMGWGRESEVSDASRVLDRESGIAVY